MFEKKAIILFVAVLFLIVGVGSLQAGQNDLESDWNDFLHYTAIGRFDLARGYAQKIIDSGPDPIEVLALSETNAAAYNVLIKMQTTSDELKDVSTQILDIIEQGRFARRTDPRIIVQEIKRLSSTIRGRLEAQKRLANAGEYAVDYMLDALADDSRKDEFPNITSALALIGRDAIRPLVAALQTDDVVIKAEVIRALGEIGYPQSLGYLKYIVENDRSEQLQVLASIAIDKIDPSAAKIGAAELLFQLGVSYYDHTPSLKPAGESGLANIWFWDKENRSLTLEEVDKRGFNELMAMRSCEWALKADQNYGKAIALWLAAFFKAEATGLAQPKYFGAAHGDATMYATTAGPEYLHQALNRAVKDKDGYVALGIVESLAANAGAKSLLSRVGTAQPLVEALSFNDRAVRYSAAIAIASAGPATDFLGSKRIVQNLNEALSRQGADELGQELADIYQLRTIKVMLQLAVTRNKVVDLSKALKALVQATDDPHQEIKVLAAQVLARIESPDAQRAIALMALSADNNAEIRISAFDSLAISAKLNANLLTDSQIDRIYALISSDDTEPDLRSATAIAYGALNLPSKRVKDLILDQAVN